MLRCTLFVVGLAVVLAPAGFAEAQLVGSPIISQDAARRAGLYRAWMTQVEFDRSHDRITNIVFYQPDPIEVPPAPGAAAPVAEPAAAEGAEPPDAAEPPAEPAPAQPARPRMVVEPGALYVQTLHGVLHAIDANTGRTLWVQQVGRREHPSTPPAISERYVAVVNASDLIVLDRITGYPIYQRKLELIPLAAPCIHGSWVYVPSLKGEIYGYNLEKPKELWNTISFGQIEFPPIITRESMVWTTSRGYTYKGNLEYRMINKRLVTPQPPMAALAYWPPRVFIATKGGYIHAMDEQTGESPWRFSMGQDFAHEPVAIYDNVYIVSYTEGMHCLSADLGTLRWSARGVARFLAASADHIYAADPFGGMLILDAKTGVQLGTMRIDRLDAQTINARTDRLFLGTNTGFLQCLHELKLPQPLIHAFPKAAKGIRVEQPPAEEPPAAENR
jgi:outer membrane protein assembly factor BamB